MGGNSPICRNAAEIALYVGISKDAVKRYKDDFGLPIWKIEEKGNWKALKVSLDRWLEKMETEYLEAD